ncbi:uncharacterized protein LOC111129254 [Crassostrea virginica]
MIAMKDISYLLVLNCAMVFVQALASTVVSVQPLADPVWGPSLPTDRLLGGLRTPCHRKCDYGYDTDIEGNLICKCKNPCRNIYCFGGTTCVVSKHCSGGSCKLDASCKDPRPQKDTSSTSPLKSQGEAVYDTQGFVQTDAGSVCRQPLSLDVFSCPKRTRRYMYDATKRKCVRFWGCRKPGNNFDKRRTCKNTCIKPYKGASKRRPKDKKCLLPVEDVTAVCFEKLRRRWVYDANTNKCIKIRGCPRPGNNFQKRLECKSQCVRRRKWKKSG